MHQNPSEWHETFEDRVAAQRLWGGGEDLSVGWGVNFF